MTRALVAIAALSLTLAACVNDGLEIEQDPAFDASRIRTWEWVRNASPVDTSDPRLASDALHASIREAIRRSLVARGLREVEKDGDVEVAYRVGIDAQRRVESETITRPVGDDVFVGPPKVEVTDEEQGRLTIVLSAPETAEVVWRGRVRVELEHDLPAEERTLRIRDAVDRILGELAPVTGARGARPSLDPRRIALAPGRASL